jgi:hypothetical protein
VGAALLTRLDTVVRPDIIIHGIKRLLVPWSLQEQPNAHHNTRSTSRTAGQAALPRSRPPPPRPPTQPAPHPPRGPRCPGAGRHRCELMPCCREKTAARIRIRRQEKLGGAPAAATASSQTPERPAAAGAWRW